MGDRDRFETDALGHLDVLFRAAWSLCRDQAQAEDLVQVTYLKALQKFESFEPRGSLKSWLLRILRNTWFDELRHRRVVGPTVSADEIPLAGQAGQEDLVWSDAEDLLENFSDEQVIRALKELPEHQRLALLQSIWMLLKRRFVLRSRKNLRQQMPRQSQKHKQK